MRRTLTALVVYGLLTAPALPALADETFLESDDYEEREGGAIGLFLGDADYALMVEEAQRNDTEFDWGWVKTEGCEAVEAPPAARGRLGRLMGKVRTTRCKSTVLGFDLRSAGTIFVPPVENLAGLIKKDLLEEIHDSFTQAVVALGLQPVDERESARLALELAVVDQMRGDVSVPVYGIHIDPFVSMELRLLDLQSGENWLLVRNRKHGDNVGDAALNFADDLVKFLR